MLNEGKIHFGEYGKKLSRGLVKDYRIKDMRNQKPLDTGKVLECGELGCDKVWSMIIYGCG